MIVNDHAPVTVENPTARSQHRDRLDAVVQCPFVVNFGILDLKLPEAGDQKQEDDDGSVLEDSDLPRGEVGVIAQGWLVGLCTSDSGIVGR